MLSDFVMYFKHCDICYYNLIYKAFFYFWLSYNALAMLAHYNLWLTFLVMIVITIILILLFIYPCLYFIFSYFKLFIKWNWIYLCALFLNYWYLKFVIFWCFDDIMINSQSIIIISQFAFSCLFLQKTSTYRNNNGY